MLLNISDLKAKLTSDIGIKTNTPKGTTLIQVSPHSDISITQGSENLYIDIDVFIEDSEDVYTLELYTKDLKKELFQFMYELKISLL
jgi:hypothetical protein